MVLHYPLWKKLLIAVLLLLGLVYALPNILPSWQNKNAKEFFALGSVLNLGLDLQGGSYLLLAIDKQQYQDERFLRLSDDIRKIMQEARISYIAISQEKTTDTAKGGVKLLLREEDKEQARALLAREFLPPSLSAPLMEIKSINGGLMIGNSDFGQKQILQTLQDQTANIIRRRIDALGNKEALVSPQGEDRLMIEVPGEQNPEGLKSAIGKTAKLSFHLLAGVGEPSFTLYDEFGAGHGLAIIPVVSGNDLVEASASFSDNQPVVSFRFSGAGARSFATATTNNVGNPIFIVLDGRIISAPVVRQPITNGSGIISGSFTVAETNELALLLKAGALPAPLTILEERTLGAGLGADSIQAGKVASALGLMGVLVVMMAVYRLPGVFSSIALLCNLMLLLAVMTAFHSTLTLPGIAGIVLTMGMAVDANVLIYERVKEEYTAGRSVLASWQMGFQRAFATIWDSNLTTLLSTLLLFIFGSGPIKGFALALSIGIVTSLFSAIMITRLLVVMWIDRFQPKTVGF